MRSRDEYLAHAEYKLILEKFGQVRPFSNIVKAEVQHISQLESLLKNNNLAVPADTAASRIVLPGTLAETYKAGVEAEILNIAMYDRFLKEKLPSDVKSVFERLKAASEKHLAAFERAVGRTEGTMPPQQPGKPSVKQTPGKGRSMNPRQRSGAARGQKLRAARCR